MDSGNVIDSAHYGYIYCMALLPAGREGSDDPLPDSSSGQVRLVTGSGDESIKVGFSPLHWMWYIFNSEIYVALVMYGLGGTSASSYA